MRFTVSAEQLKFFDLHGYLELEKLISPDEIKSLSAAFVSLCEKSPGYPTENCFRSIPLIATLARKNGWGQIAAALLHQTPLRISYDHFWPQAPKSLPYINKESCGLLLDLTTGQGLFFKKSLPENLYNTKDSCYLFLILTAKHLPEGLNPVIIR